MNARATPYFSAAAAARPGTGSHTAWRRTWFCTSAWLRWGRMPRSAIAPAPTTPIRTMSAIVVTPLAQAAPDADTATGTAFLHDPGEAEQVWRLTASRMGVDRS